MNSTKIPDSNLHAAEALSPKFDESDLIQGGLLPKLSNLPGCAVSAYYQPAEALGGGDWFGHFVAEQENRVYFFIGDVTGHGMSAALLTGLAYGSVFSLAKVGTLEGVQDDRSPETKLLQLASVLNSVFHSAAQKKFMTMAFLSLDMKSGECLYVNAGHPPFFLARNSTEPDAAPTIKPMASLGSPLGCYEEPKFKLKSFKIHPGDTVFLYTDGLLENHGANGERLSYKELQQAIAEGVSAAPIVAKVRERIGEIWGDTPFQDDVTVLCFTWEGLPA